MTRYGDYRDELRKRGVPFGKPWVERATDKPEQQAENVVPIKRREAV